MKPYRDLCNSYKTYQTDRIAYRDRAVHAVATALIELQRFLEAPDDVCRFTPVKEKRKNGTVYSPQGAVHLDDDGWWSGCLLVDVSSEGDGLAKDGTICFTIGAFVEPERVTFRVGDSQKRHVCNDVNAERLAPVIGEALSRAKLYLESGLERFLDEFREPTPQRIGFV